MAIGWGTAFATSGIITAIGIFSVFLPTHWSYQSIIHNPGEFEYSLLLYLGGQFFASVASLKGLSKAGEAAAHKK